MTAIERQPADRADGVPNQARDVLARADDGEDPEWVTFIDTNRERSIDAWISAEADAVIPIGTGWAL